MANQEQLDILKQGVEVWNNWRKKHRRIIPDLSEANLSNTYLAEAELSGADLNGADLSSSTLARIEFSKANLSQANLSEAWLQGANLHGANLHGANLSKASLSGADLLNDSLGRIYVSGADLSVADLSQANLSRAYLARVNLSGADLSDADLSGARIGWTIFGDVNLKTVKGLETVIHYSPSIIGTNTLLRSQGDIPVAFLRGAGLNDAFITYARALVQHPIEYYTCFISYSSKDEDFAQRLYADLQSKGVRCWFAPEDMDIGDKIQPRIEESIRLHNKLLLVLSENSIASNWVAYEVEKALNKEPAGIPNVLYPIRLDDTVKNCKTTWANDIRSTRHIGDFSNWKNHDDYQKAFNKLLRALKAETQKQ